MGYSHWIAGFDRVFIKHDAKWTILGSANQLDVQVISAERLYSGYIFPSFDKMSEYERYQHLEHIRVCMYSSNKLYNEMKKEKYHSDTTKEKIDDAKTFIYDLKTLKCIGPDHSTLQPISAFCDHTIKIFKVFASNSKFRILPEQLTKNYWLDFFRELGLTQFLTKSEYLELCNKTAARNVSDVNKCADVLLEYLFTDEVKKLWHADNIFLSQVSDIAFAYTTDTSSVRWIVPGAYQANQLVKLNGAALHSLKNLLWTVRPLIRLPFLGLSWYNDSETIQIVEGLNITHKMSLAVSDVVLNIQNICRQCPYTSEHLFNNYRTDILPPNKVTTTLLEIMFDNFQFLNLRGTFDVNLRSLSDFQCIPVHCDLQERNKKMVLVKPSCVLIGAPELKDFHPYLHKIPFDFRNLTTVLEEIGVKHSLKVEHMQIVLQKIFLNCNGSQLDPNAKEHVKKALCRLQKFLRDEDTSKSELEHLSPLYLPDTKEELKLSTTMLYGDTSSYYRRMDLDLRSTPYSQFHISKKEYGMNPANFCQLLPVKVRPLGMSVKCHLVLAEECKAEEPSELSLSIQKSVQFEENPSAVAELFNKLIPSSETDEVDLMSLVEDFFASLGIKTMSNLKTSIVLTELDKVIGNEKSNFYIDHIEHGYVLYIDSKFDDKDDIFTEIAKQLFKIISNNGANEDVSFDSKTELLEAIRKYLNADTLSKKKNVLLRYDCEAIIKYSGRFSLELGEEIPDNYHHRLDQDVHNIFHPMEFVGYEEREGHIKVAQIAHLNPGANHELEKRYVIYVSKDDSDGKEVSILNLYKFIIAPRKAQATSDSKSLSVVPFTSESEAINLRKSLYEGDQADIKRRLLQELKEIWKLRSELRNKAVRRLYLKWHPDKNLDDPERAQEIFLFLKEQIDILENSVYLQESGAPRSRSGGVGGGFGSHFNQWDRMASRHRATSSWEDELRRNNPSSASPFDRAQEDKRPEEGKRWVKQAEIDYKVLCDIHSKASTSLGYGHVCFMAHQVVEKALKGGVYALCGMDGRGLTDHNLTRHAYALQMSKPAQTQSLAQHCSPPCSPPLESYYLDTRYPNRWPGYTDTPSEHYTSVNADSAKDHAKAVLDIVNDIMPPV